MRWDSWKYGDGCGVGSVSPDVSVLLGGLAIMKANLICGLLVVMSISAAFLAAYGGLENLLLALGMGLGVGVAILVSILVVWDHRPDLWGR